MRKKFLKDAPAQQALGPGTRNMALDLTAGLFHQVTKLYVRRAGGLARPAVEAQVHVLDEIGGHGEAPFIYCFDQVDAPTRRIHLGAQGAIGRTFIKTEAAMNTGRNLLPWRTIELIKTGPRC